MEEDAILCTCRVALATQARPPMGGSLSLYVQTPIYVQTPTFFVGKQTKAAGISVAELTMLDNDARHPLFLATILDTHCSSDA